jgi:hypothetical protein
MLRMHDAKVDTHDWTGTFYTQVIGAHLSPSGSDIKEVWVYVAIVLMGWVLECTSEECGCRVSN